MPKQEVASNMINDITLKEVYERVVSLEAKMDEAERSNQTTRHYFRNLAFLIVFLSGLNLIVHTILIFLQL